MMRMERLSVNYPRRLSVLNRVVCEIEHRLPTVEAQRGRPYSVRQYMVFVTYILYKTILGQRFWSDARNKGTMRSTGDAFASFRLWTAHVHARPSEHWSVLVLFFKYQCPFRHVSFTVSRLFAESMQVRYEMGVIIGSIYFAWPVF